VGAGRDDARRLRLGRGAPGGLLMAAKLVVQGGTPLRGEVPVSAAKNAALPALALAYALEFPDDLSGLVLLAPAVYESDDGVSFLSKLPGFPIIGDVVNFLFTPLIGPWLVRTDVTKAFAPDPIPKQYLRHVLSEWTRPRKVKWYSVDDALLNSSLPKFTPRYSDIRIPVVIVTGDSDLIVPAKENAHRLYEALPHAELVVLEKTGHQIPFTRPDAVVDAIDRVAAKTELSGAPSSR